MSVYDVFHGILVSLYHCRYMCCVCGVVVLVVVIVSMHRNQSFVHL